MFGNRIGWLFSAIIVAFTTSFLWLFYIAATQPTPPTSLGQRAASFALQMPDVSPRSVATFLTEPRDAVALYRQAITLYESNSRPFDIFIDRPSLQSPDLPEIQPAMDLLIQASTRSNAGVFGDRPSELITYDPDRAALQALQKLGDIAARLARLQYLAGQIDQAKPLYQAAFALGVKLYDERLVFAELDAGLQLLAVSRYLGELAEQENHTNQAALFRQFDQQRLAYFKAQVQPPQEAIFVTHPHTGDLIALANNAGDPMWRIEATLGLGRCRFSAPSRGDQIGAVRMLKLLAKSTDSPIRLAADQALALTVEQFRKLR